MNDAPVIPGRPITPSWTAWILATVTVVLFLPVAWHEFINYDTPLYIANNPLLQAGLTWKGVVWAFTEYHSSHWHPLTLISHMLDCQIHGLNPGGHHLTNALFHAANSALVFILLNNLTRAQGRSAIVAALFAAHPLHVESVAWIAERQDVLSAFFGLLSLLAYTRYARHGGRRWFAATGLLLAFGLMTKAMLVTWPCVMLLLDFWPLNRAIPDPNEQAANASPRRRIMPPGTARLALEKIPFFALSAAVCILAIRAQSSGETFSSLESLPFLARLANATVAYGIYLKMMIWPVGLSIHYPHPGAWPAWQVAVSAVVVIGATAAALRFWRRAPYAIMGWLWYLGTLVPVIGFVQVGPQAYADRYFYIPSIGLFAAIVWSVEACANHFLGQRGRRTLAMAAAGCVVACCIATSAQLRKWRSSETLFLHTLSVSPNNDVAHNNLGVHYRGLGEDQKALKHFLAASHSAINPQASFNLANTLCNLRRDAEAVPHYEAAIALAPGYDRAHNNLALALERLGRLEEAIRHFESAIRLNPEHPGAHLSLAYLQLRRDRPLVAADSFAEAARLDPENPRTPAMLGAARMAAGEHTAAIAAFRESLAIDPGQADVRAELGSALAAAGRPGEARTELLAALRMAESRPDWRAAIQQALANLPAD